MRMERMRYVFFNLFTVIGWYELSFWILIYNAEIYVYELKTVVLCGFLGISEFILSGFLAMSSSAGMSCNRN